MPKNTSTRVLDARPDRVDYSDRMYQPKLASLPERFPDLEFIRKQLGKYKHLVLDQGDEGACAGFGLAALINYLLWKKEAEKLGDDESDKPIEIVQVSPRMLHTMARFYDEWPGEDYLGTSCRGAMKGWYRHGVCSEALWPYRRSPRHKASFIKPTPGWQEDAASRPLGAFYRVRKESITDMQSALCEVGALYVSARYHDGWGKIKDYKKPPKTPPVIQLAGNNDGAHVFALVGYEPRGFIIQNSWGQKWGYSGFAILTYEDWAKNSLDAWAAVLGAPMEVEESYPSVNVRARRRVGLVGVAARPRELQKKARGRTMEILAPADAYQHTVVVGNNGNPSNRFLDIETAKKAVEETVHVLPKDWLRKNKSNKVVIFAQDGLHTEEAAIDRIRVLAPYFKANGIYPIFITWRAGFKDSLARLIDHAVTEYLTPATALSKLGVDPATVANSMGLDPDEHRAMLAGGSQSKESRDQSVEVACQDLMVKPIWMQMKRNAEIAQSGNGALAEIGSSLQRLKNSVRKLEVHIVGHSAGAILVGNLLSVISRKRMRVASCTLYAPACTVEFACKTFLPPMRKRVLQSGNLHIEMLSDKRESRDSIGSYGKSLLYLVSRGMEDTSGVPVLGMEKVWDEEQWPDWPDDVDSGYLKYLSDLRRFCRGKVSTKTHNTFARGKERVPATHLGFDYDPAVIGRLIKRIRGSSTLRKRIGNLDH